jgi:hypothetical protein
MALRRGANMTLTTVDAGMLNSQSQQTWRNRIINGAMVIDQRNAGASITANNTTFSVDRFKMLASVASKFTSQQNAGSVTPPTGFINYAGYTSSSAYSVGAAEVFAVQQNIEGLNIFDFEWGTASAQPITLSFWVRASLTGTYSVVFKNSAANRSYVASYTVSASNTWEQKTITIAGDTSGTWLTTSGIGLRLYFTLAAGSTQVGSAGSWQAADLYGVTGGISVVGTNGATFYITGVQLEKGSTATSFDYRPYGTELQLAQRYYEFDTYKLLVASNGSNLLIGRLTYKVPKRIAVTLGLSNAGISGGYNPPTAQAASSVNGIDVERTGGEINFGWTASAEL